MVSVNLSDSQKRALDISLKGHSLFLTGKGGTGKTFLLEQIWRDLSAAETRESYMHG